MTATLGTVLISGANRGLGLELVRQLSGNANNRIFAATRNPDEASELQSLAKDRKNISVLNLDVTKDSDIEQAVEHVAKAAGYLNVLFNNAGILKCRGAPLTDVTREGMSEHFNVNVTSAVLMAKAFRELLAKGPANHESKKNSVIVNVSSEMGSITNASTRAYPYRTSKTALNMASKCLANELAPEKIYCISIHPGHAKTDMGGAAATVPVPDSVTGIIKVTSELTDEQNGNFIDYLGKDRLY